jgi:type II secretory pathway pseudopilin PulG
MKFFSKKEIGWILVILILIASASLYNFRISLRRARDAQRKADLGQIANAVGAFQNDFGFYPPSLDGKIVACKKDGVDNYAEYKDSLLTKDNEIDLFEIYAPCEWGNDSLSDVFEPEYPPYIDTLPMDPQGSAGAYYTYISNKNRFQLYTGLEGKDEDDMQSVIAERNISCGLRICDFGRASGATPLEKSIKEYENELLQKKQNEE